MPLNEKPHENFLRTPLSEAHKCDKCVRVGYIFYYEASQIRNINRMSGEALSSLWLATTNILVLI